MFTKGFDLLLYKLFVLEPFPVHALEDNFNLHHCSEGPDILTKSLKPMCKFLKKYPGPFIVAVSKSGKIGKTNLLNSRPFG